MKFLNKMERKIGKYAIPNLTMVIITCFIIGYVLYYLAPDIYGKLVLIPYDVVVKNEYWRLITWIITIPSGLSIFTFIMLFFYYWIGSNLEMTWGKFMYNLYIFGGMLIVSLAMLITGLIQFKLGPNSELYVGVYEKMLSTGAVTVDNLAVQGTYFMTLSMFLAFAAIYSDATVLLYFIIPFKVKWLAYIDLIFLGISFVEGNIYSKVVIVAGVANFFIYYFINRRRKGRSFAQMKRKRTFDRSVKEGMRKANKNKNRFEVINNENYNPKIINPNPKGITMHKCAVCGRTENDGDDLEFRFCSKCNGNYEYCMEHLFTHEHVK